MRNGWVEKMVLEKKPDVFALAHQMYLAGNFQQSFDLLSGTETKSPESKWQKNLWQICLAARLNNPGLAEELLRKSLDEGIFFNESTLRRDEDLISLQGRPQFEALVGRDLALLGDMKKKTSPGLTLLESVDMHFERIPLLMALHGNNSNVERFLGYWNTLAEEGWLVALPQSSQLAGNDVYCWNDQDLAKKEILDHYAAISQKITVDTERTVVAGFSMGGFTAIRAALLQYFPARGFLAVCPYIRDIAEMEKLLASVNVPNLRGYLLLGQDDKGCTPNALLLRELLNRHGIACELELFPHVGHDFPENYRAAIGRGLQYIMK